MTHLELAVDNLDCRMIALLVMEGAHPSFNVFDGNYVHHPQRSDVGFFTEYTLLDTFDGIHPIPGFAGLHALLPRLSPWQGGDVQPVRLLLNAIESAMAPLPNAAALSFVMPPGTRCSVVHNSLCTSSVCSANGPCWTDFSVERFANAAVAQMAIARYFDVQFGTNLPEIACRIAALVMKDELWAAIDDVSKAGTQEGQGIQRQRGSSA